MRPPASNARERSLCQVEPRGGWCRHPTRRLSERDDPAQDVLFSAVLRNESREHVNTKHPAVIAVAFVVGVALIVLAVVYWAEPAGSLPSWIPGHAAGSGHHHVKHGIAAFLVGLACLVFAWFRSAGPRPRSAAV